jgi:hypothetical protein
VPQQRRTRGFPSKARARALRKFFLFSTFFKSLLNCFFTISYAYKTITSYTTQLRHRCAPTATNTRFGEGRRRGKGSSPMYFFFLFSTFLMLIELSFCYLVHVRNDNKRLHYTTTPSMCPNGDERNTKKRHQRHVFLLVSVFFYFFSFFYIYYLVYVDYIVRRRRNNVTALPCRRCVNTPHPRLKRESLG